MVLLQMIGLFPGCVVNAAPVLERRRLTLSSARCEARGHHREQGRSMIPSLEVVKEPGSLPPSPALQPRKANVGRGGARRTPGFLAAVSSSLLLLVFKTFSGGVLPLPHGHETPGFCSCSALGKTVTEVSFESCERASSLGPRFLLGHLGFILPPEVLVLVESRIC